METEELKPLESIRELEPAKVPKFFYFIWLLALAAGIAIGVITKEAETPKKKSVKIKLTLIDNNNIPLQYIPFTLEKSVGIKFNNTLTNVGAIGVETME